MIYLYSIIIGYLLGSVNPCYIFGRLHGLDMRKEGTGNCGASNAKVVLGWKYFFMCTAYDVSKCALAMFLVQYLLKGAELPSVTAGCAAIMGHCFPFYLGFKGGKGFASLIGLSAFMTIPGTLILLALGISGSFLTNYIVFGTLTFIVGVPLYLYFFTTASSSAVLAVTVICIIMLFKHRINLVRFLRKQEIGINGDPVGIKLLKDTESESA